MWGTTLKCHWATNCLNTNNTHITNMVQDSSGGATQAAHVNGGNQRVDPQLKTPDYQAQPDQQKQLDGPAQADSQTDPDSEIEIWPARKRRYLDPGSDPSTREKTGDGRNTRRSYYTESDLSSLDHELNEALTSKVVGADSSLGQNARPNFATMAALPKFFIPPSRSRSPPPVGYGNMPPNLMNAIHGEKNLVFDGSAEDEIEVFGKRTSLKDQLPAIDSPNGVFSWAPKAVSTNYSAPSAVACTWRNYYQGHKCGVSQCCL